MYSSYMIHRFVSSWLRSLVFFGLATACAAVAAQTGARLLQAPLSELVEPAPAVVQPTAPSPRTGTARTSFRASVLGTGFAIAPGYVLTAHHVIQNRPTLLVGPIGKSQWIAAEVVKSDPQMDLALLSAKVPGPGLTIATDTLAPTGLEISVIGFPQPAVQGLSAKITQGIINGTKANAQAQTLLQISSEITTGNSGSPVLAPDGTVVGLVQRKVNAQKVAERGNDLIINVAYAMPSSPILQFLADTPAAITTHSLNLGKVLRPYQIFKESQPSIYSVVSRQATSAPTSPPSGQELQLQ